MAVPILSDIFGTKPKIAPYIPTEFGPEQIKALKENIAAFPEITKLGNLYQDYMTSAFNEAIPGFSDILATGGALTQKMQATAGEELAGEIPQDVQEQVQRSSAFQNLMSGGGGGMASANTARNFGLTSLDLIGKGAQLQETAGNAAQRWAGLASNLVMSPAGYLVTPQQQVELTMSNRLHQQATQQLRENVAAAPDPIAKGLSDIVENLTAAYLGGKVGKIGAGNAAATEATGSAFGPQMESAFAGYDDFGNQINTGGGGGSGGDTSFSFGTGGYSKDTGGGTAYNPYGSGFDYGAGYPTPDASQYFGTGPSPFLYNQYGVTDFTGAT